MVSRGSEAETLRSIAAIDDGRESASTNDARSKNPKKESGGGRGPDRAAPTDTPEKAKPRPEGDELAPIPGPGAPFKPSPATPDANPIDPRVFTER